MGPDLSTIGTKYGKDELLHSILNPSAAIGYSYITLVVATKDGRTISGLPIDRPPIASCSRPLRASAYRANRGDRGQVSK